MKAESFYLTALLVSMVVPGLIVTGIIAECAVQIAEQPMPPTIRPFYNDLGVVGVGLTTGAAMLGVLASEWIKHDLVRSGIRFVIAVCFSLFIAAGVFATGHALKTMLDLQEVGAKVEVIESDSRSI